jgi:cysteine desulfurase
MNEIYLDHNATTALAPEVAEAMDACRHAAIGNAGSQHHAGRRARQMLEEAREEIAAILGADLRSAQPDRLLFTSGGTEANNLALFGLCGSTPGRLIISTIEHPSVVGPAEELARRGWELVRAPVTADGVVDLERFAECVEPPAALRTQRLPLIASVMLGNNETGVLQPLEQVASLCARTGARLHTDAVQVAGKLPIEFRSLGVDAMSVSAHKFHGPCGIGALLLRPHVVLQPQMFGGFQQEGLRPGTESVALAVGMYTALRLWQGEEQSRVSRLTALRERLESGLLAVFPEAVVHGSGVPRLPHTTNVSFPGLNRQALVMALDLAEVACSSGSACASGSSDPSPTLIAMGCPGELLDSSIRFSLGASTTAAEVDEVVRRIRRVCNDLQTAKPGRNFAGMGRTSA